ncbi:hypothetical protein SDC9_120835 [bioreactor metagenome]|uniref:LPS-assembly protein LptD n=1 Tax=bioreactor metagenome TaxID=1076179 RepID=A0A645CA95_9ZZZZ
MNGNERFERVNEFLLSNGKGFARLTNATINISTSFSSQGFIDKNTNVDTAKKTGTIDNELGGRFLRRDAYIENDGDIYGENSCGYSRFAFPWSASLGLNYNYLHTNIGKIDRKLNLTTSFDFTLAETWKVSTRFQYDLINMQFIAPEINLTKDLHCWDLTASWYPTGYNQGFYIRFGIKSSQLKDLKIEKRDSPVFR